MAKEAQMTKRGELERERWWQAAQALRAARRDPSPERIALAREIARGTKAQFDAMRRIDARMGWR